MARPASVNVGAVKRAQNAFLLYRALSLQLLDARANIYETLPEAHRRLLPSSIPDRLSAAAAGTELNAQLLEKVAALAGNSAPETDEDGAVREEIVAVAAQDLSDVRSALRSLAHDWAEEFAERREKLYGPVIEAVSSAAEDAVAAGAVSSSTQFSVLVPGAGLGRLAWELAAKGLTVEGTERGYHQLLLCNYVLNATNVAEGQRTRIRPFVHDVADSWDAKGVSWQVEIPDVDPAQIGSDSRFGMVAGEFLDVYEEEESWDAVATVAFLESAHNVVAYVRRIAKILRKGGVWINHGTLSYAFGERDDEPCIELTGEELYQVISRLGFKVLRRDEVFIEKPRAPDALVSTREEMLFFVAVKV